jgi:iron complex transport system substrate-binding protein
MRRFLIAAVFLSSFTVRASSDVAAEAQRVISIIPATTEMLFAMGAGDRVVAVGTYDRFPPEVARLPRVGALLDPDVERIIALRPDLVIVYGTQADLLAQLDRAGIPYFPYVHRGLSDIPATIRALGMRIGMMGQADSLATHLEQQLADVRRRVAGQSRPKTLLVFSREPGTLRNINSSGGVGFLHDMLEVAGGDDVLSDVRQQAVITSTEMILTRAPDVIVELAYARSQRALASDIRAWNALSSVPAVRNRRVYFLEGDEFVVPGPRVGLATEQLSRVLHPSVWQ